jgi:hypothetical protein
MKRKNEILVLTYLGLGILLLVIGLIAKVNIITYSGIGFLSGGLTIGVFEFLKQSGIIKD